MTITDKTWAVGVDEVGLGALAGPLVVGAFMIPPASETSVQIEKCNLPLRDSKKNTRQQNHEIADWVFRITDRNMYGWHYSIRGRHPNDIDRFGIAEALNVLPAEAVLDVLEEAELSPKQKIRVIMDGSPIRGRTEAFHDHLSRWKQLKLHFEPKADGKYHAVMVAANIAKSYRVKLMADLAKQHPGWDFENNDGYGNPQHMEVLRARGPIQGVHRMSYKPCKELAR